MLMGKECKIEGCCVQSQEFHLKETCNTPDISTLLQDLYQILFHFPSSILFFFQDLYKHLIQPKRPSWNIMTTITIAILHAMRSIMVSVSLDFWRRMLRLPYFVLYDTNTFIAATFEPTHASLKGVLKNQDAEYIKAEWILPPESEEEKVILFFHGGGYCLKDWFSFIRLSERLSSYTARAVFVQSYFHLIEYYKIKPQHITIIGDSAGGGLAMSLLMYLRDHQYPLPEASVLLSPWIDLTYQHPSWSESFLVDFLPPRPDKNSIVNPACLYLGLDNYKQLSSHTYASPLFSNHFENLPPILIQSGECETMRDEIRVFTKRLQQQQHSTVFRHEEYEDMVHDFQVFDFPQSFLALKHIQQWLAFCRNDKNGVCL
ncbi:Alpha/Beta hydrolase protein [Gilbertella persicaria]|uniref:Alpha/Beta hydrolase protein n=1 Tax=Gilbertella persicaria TaxID=101096 RepID=UPI0022206CDD|nr:Alpha/Beta hydrolase protein [Gilbertella persicaria]KAI8088052.1 Alpha/Beta hydrolase protein [Gilbertella persicaria]